MPGKLQQRLKCVKSAVDVEFVQRTEADIPGEDADWDQWTGIPSFAASFNGYQYWGSFKKCFEVGRRDGDRRRNRMTITFSRQTMAKTARRLASGEPNPETPLGHLPTDPSRMVSLLSVATPKWTP